MTFEDCLTFTFED